MLLFSLPLFFSVKWNRICLSPRKILRVEFDLHSTCTGASVCLSLIPANRNHLQINLKEHILSSLGDFLQRWKTYLHTAPLCCVPTWFFPSKGKWLQIGGKQWPRRRDNQGAWLLLSGKQSLMHTRDIPVRQMKADKRNNGEMRWEQVVPDSEKRILILNQ